MPSASITGFVTLIVSYTWACISVTSYINSVFSHDSRLFRYSFCSFSPGLISCDGLLNIRKSLDRASIAWFETLPDISSSHSWSIYIQILLERKIVTFVHPIWNCYQRSTIPYGRISFRQESCLRYRKSYGQRLSYCPLRRQLSLPYSSSDQIPFARVSMVAVDEAFPALYSAMLNRYTSYSL
jgi:hypothetical protein